MDWLSRSIVTTALLALSIASVIAQEADDLPALVSRLDHDDFDVREAAQASLVSSGSKARAFLRSQLQREESFDSEKRWRMEAALLELDLQFEPVDALVNRAASELQHMEFNKAARFVAAARERLTLETKLAAAVLPAALDPLFQCGMEQLGLLARSLDGIQSELLEASYDPSTDCLRIAAMEYKGEPRIGLCLQDGMWRLNITAKKRHSTGC